MIHDSRCCKNSKLASSRIVVAINAKRSFTTSITTCFLTMDTNHTLFDYEDCSPEIISSQAITYISCIKKKIIYPVTYYAPVSLSPKNKPSLKLCKSWDYNAGRIILISYAQCLYRIFIKIGEHFPQVSGKDTVIQTYILHACSRDKSSSSSKSNSLRHHNNKSLSHDKFLQEKKLKGHSWNFKVTKRKCCCSWF